MNLWFVNLSYSKNENESREKTNYSFVIPYSKNENVLR